MKLKYILYMAAALSLTGCNDSFLERGPQNLNDQSFWAVSYTHLDVYKRQPQDRYPEEVHLYW